MARLRQGIGLTVTAKNCASAFAFHLHSLWILGLHARRVSRKFDAWESWNSSGNPGPVAHLAPGAARTRRWSGEGQGSGAVGTNQHLAVDAGDRLAADPYLALRIALDLHLAGPPNASAL